MKFLTAILLSGVFAISSCAYQSGIRQLGTGPETIIFIHGLGSYLPAWKMNIDSLRKDYRCIAVDLPGYGKSSKGKYPGSMTFFAGIIREFAQKMNLQEVTLAGHSMGGQIAIVAALGYPELVKKLILMAPAGFETFHKGQREWFREVFTPDLVKLTSVNQIRENLGYNFYRFPESAAFMITDRIEMRSAIDFPGYCYIIPECVKGMVDEPVFDYLPDVSQPTIVFFGEYDNLIPNRFLNGGKTEKYARMGAERIPDCTLHMIPEAGHFVQFESWKTVNHHILQFMSQ